MAAKGRLLHKQAPRLPRTALLLYYCRLSKILHFSILQATYVMRARADDCIVLCGAGHLRAREQQSNNPCMTDIYIYVLCGGAGQPAVQERDAASLAETTAALESVAQTREYLQQLLAAPP